MKYLKWIAFIAICTFLLSSCSTSAGTKSARLYTSEGQIIDLQFTPVDKYRGTISGAFPDGEKLSGEYYTTFNKQVDSAFLSTPWGPISGVAFSQKGPLTSYVTAMGENGTVFQAVTQGEHYHGFGAGRDSKGRLYRIHY